VRSASSGVAPVTPSSARAPPNTQSICVAKSTPLRPGHCDISAGKLTISSAYASIAGLNGFWPRPP
jgi:hypothetical protein